MTQGQPSLRDDMDVSGIHPALKRRATIDDRYAVKRDSAAREPNGVSRTA
jgi:hypothetical protein